MTANPMRGEAEFGKHKLVVTFNGWCALEAATGQKVPELLADLGSKAGLGFLQLRVWVRNFLDADLPGEKVGDMIGEMGIEAAMLALGTAVNGFFPEAEKGKKPNPPKAA